ncbi:MAG: leucine-rich repeat protein [Candidatus Aquicultor sp.]|nr:leucine-rich repeat protein [Candidatus Aquicultor sp.]
MKNYNRAATGLLVVLLAVSILFIGTIPALAEIGINVGDNYPEPWRSGGGTPYYKDGIFQFNYDSWGYAVQNCTSWVAWALHDRNGFETPRGLGNASTWGIKAKENYKVDNTPAVGAVAWWPSGEFGHVAWVKSVNRDGTVTIEEYNYNWSGRYNRRDIQANSVQYIHFKDIPEFIYTKINGGAEITGYTGNGGAVKIPRKLDGLTVTSIGNNAFNGYRNTHSDEPTGTVTSIGNNAVIITSIAIPDGVTSIGDAAFAYCRNLTTMFILSEVTSVGRMAFYGCSGLENIVFFSPDTSIYDEEYTIPATTNIIGWPWSTASDYAAKYGRTFEDFISKFVKSLLKK